MAEQSYQDIVDMLRHQLGTRVDGTQVEGRGAIISTLRDQLKLSQQEAEMTIDRLMADGMLRYNEPTSPEREREAPTSDAERSLHGAGAVIVANSGLGSGTTAPAIAGNIDLETHGFWQIGVDEPASDLDVRKGQVRPTGL